MTNAVKLELVKDISTPENIVVGKDILELVSGAMYVDPLNLYREYVQNATDSIDQKGNGEGGKVEITLDPNQRSISVRDNGVGVKNKDFSKVMTAIGGSQKRSIPGSRGFRGVGRLAGLGYCRSLSFRSKGDNDKQIREITWDCVRFKKILRDSSFRGDLKDVIKQVCTVSSSPALDDSPFFEVTMNGVVRLKNDVLLNGEAVENYLSQVAPVPFHPKFSFSSDLDSKLSEYGIGSGYTVTLVDKNLHEDKAGQNIYRPHRDEFMAAGGKIDGVGTIQYFELPGRDGEVAAIGWIAETSYYGALPPSGLVKGIRFRVGNIQVGESDIVANEFPESRFNSWSIGEVHVVTNKVIPNGRRDNFEDNIHYEEMLGQLQPYLKSVAQVCRKKSSRRQWTVRFDAKVNAVGNELALLESGSLSKSKITTQIKKIGSGILELEELIANSNYEWTNGLNYKITPLQKRLKKFSNRKTNNGKDPLKDVPYQTRLAYQEVLHLVYEVAVNKEVANMMIEKLVKRLAAKHGDK
jgi:hypothetical protein